MVSLRGHYTDRHDLAMDLVGTSWGRGEKRKVALYRARLVEERRNEFAYKMTIDAFVLGWGTSEKPPISASTHMSIPTGGESLNFKEGKERLYGEIRTMWETLDEDEKNGSQIGIIEPESPFNQNEPEYYFIIKCKSRNH